MITKQTIDRVFETAKVEDIIGEFVQLKKAGSNFKGLSPFTDERTPSFMVSPVKQIWKDFSTGKGGNVISFLMEHEHYSYPEAIRYLAKKYNIEIEETEQSDEEKQQINERESMFLVSKFAKDYFHDLMLNTQHGKAIGLSYFKERGFTENTIKKFELGYAKDTWSNFTDAALKKGYELKYLASTGLTIVKGNKHFDRFKGRVLFPIHSMSGRILGFGGRILTNDKKIAKYLNSPESDIYHKSKILYGIYHAKKEIAKQNNCFLVEGYTDVISFHQSGIKNVVASSGTALTPNQIRLIRRLTKNITVLFDGDAAGIRASIRGIDLILEQGMNVKVVSFLEGEDPDNFAKCHSDNELKEYLEENSRDFINFKVSLLLKETKNDPVKKAGLIRNIVTSISKIPDSIQREVYIQECSRIMEISERVLFSELAQLLKKEKTTKHQQRKPALAVVKENVTALQKINTLDVLEKEIIRILLLYGNDKVDFIDWIEEKDENGKITLKKDIYTRQIAKELFLNLQDDELEYASDSFKKIYSDLIYQLVQKEKNVIEQFTKHQDKDIANEVISVLMDAEKYVLSRWESKDIFPKNIKAVLPKAVFDIILRIRSVWIKLKIKKMLEQVEKNNEGRIDRKILEEISEYNKLNLKLSNNLARVV